MFVTSNIEEFKTLSHSKKAWCERKRKRIVIISSGAGPTCPGAIDVKIWPCMS